jgi:hypothetical protein
MVPVRKGTKVCWPCIGVAMVVALAAVALLDYLSVKRGFSFAGGAFSLSFESVVLALLIGAPVSFLCEMALSMAINARAVLKKKGK